MCDKGRPSTDQMRVDWDARARDNPYHYVVSGREIWTKDEFYQSGEESVRKLILDDLGRVTQGKDPKRMRVLELGCGPGRMTRSLATVFGEVFAVDVSAEMLVLAREALQDRPNVKLCQTDGRDLSILGKVDFDFALSFIVFQHIPEIEIIESYVGEVARLLKPGGMLKLQVQGRWRSQQERRDTWLGCSVSAKEVAGWIKRYPLDLLDFSGIGTQYFWLWMRKRDRVQTQGDENDEYGIRIADPAVQKNALHSAQVNHLEGELELRTRWAEGLEGELELRTRWAEGLEGELELRTHWAEGLESELESRTRWAERSDRELEATRAHLRDIYGSPAYRVGRRLRLAPEPFLYEPEQESDC